MRRVEYKRREEKEEREKRKEKREFMTVYMKTYMFCTLLFFENKFISLYISLLFKSTPSFFELCKSIRARVV